MVAIINLILSFIHVCVFIIILYKSYITNDQIIEHINHDSCSTILEMASVYLYKAGPVLNHGKGEL